MGTSISSAGPGSNSPLVPPGVDDQPQQPLPTPQPRRFQPFRLFLGRFVSNGDRNDLKRAISHYARKASGGSEIAARRMGVITKAGGSLFVALSGIPTAPGEVSIDLENLVGQPCDSAISAITQALTPEGEDSDKIRTAMNHALVEALDGVETFDLQSITEDIIVDIMIGYLAECIFLLIVMDAGKAWNKAETPAQTIRAETDLRELIKVVVDKHVAYRLTGSVPSLTQEQMVQVERTGCD